MKQRDITVLLNSLTRSSTPEVAQIGKFLHSEYEDLSAMRRQIKGLTSICHTLAVQIQVLNDKLNIHQEAINLSKVRKDEHYGIAVESEDVHDEV